MPADYFDPLPEEPDPEAPLPDEPEPDVPEPLVPPEDEPDAPLPDVPPFALSHLFCFHCGSVGFRVAHLSDFDLPEALAPLPPVLELVEPLPLFEPDAEVSELDEPPMDEPELLVLGDEADEPVLPEAEPLPIDEPDAPLPLRDEPELPLLLGEVLDVPLLPIDEPLPAAPVPLDEGELLDDGELVEPVLDEP